MKKTIIQLIILSLFNAFIYCQKPLNDSIISVGLIKFDDKNYTGALFEFEKVLISDKTNEKAIIAKTNTLIKLGNLKEAEEFVNSGVESYPDQVVFYFARGLILNSKNMFKKAIPDFDKALMNSSSETIVKAYISRGIAYQGLNYYDEAIEDFTSYLKIDNDNINVLYYRGFTYHLKEDYKNAIKDFEKVIERDSNNAYAYYNLGMAYYRINNLLNACKNFQAACQLNVTNACKMILTDCAKNP